MSCCGPRSLSVQTLVDETVCRSTAGGAQATWSSEAVRIIGARASYAHASRVWVFCLVAHLRLRQVGS